MRKVKHKKHDQDFEKALDTISYYMEDVRHNVNIIFENDMARSNETRYQHIMAEGHSLTLKDIETFKQEILKTSKLVKDKKRKNTWIYYIKRKSKSKEYIIIPVEETKRNKQMLKVKTMFIAKHPK